MHSAGNSVVVRLYKGSGDPFPGFCLAMQGVASNNQRTYYPQNMQDGLWHHVAVVHRGSDNYGLLYCDYVPNNNGKWKQGKTVASRPTGFNYPLFIGCSDLVGDGTFAKQTAFKGKIACLRVTKRQLMADEMLRAYPTAEKFADKTLFHYSFEGANGDLPALFTNRAENALLAAAADQYVYSGLSPELHIGVATQKVYVVTNAIVTPAAGEMVLVNDLPVVITNSIPARKLLWDGDPELASDTAQKLGLNRTSAFLDGIEAGVARSKGGYVAGADDQFASFAGGSFTVEWQGRFDVDRLRSLKVMQPGDKYALTYRSTAFALTSTATTSDKKDLAYNGVCSLLVDVRTNGTEKSSYLQFAACTNGAKASIYSVQLLKNVANDFLRKWHAYAVTYDHSTKTVRLYVDKELKKTAVLPNPIDFENSGVDRWIFGNGGLNNNGWIGCVDEFRVSRVVLEPKGFLTTAYSTGTTAVIR